MSEMEVNSAELETGAGAAESPAVGGVWVPALTPLRPDLSIDAGRCAEHARRLLAQGCHGVAVFGTTGEATSFSVEERTALLEALLEAGLEPARLLVGTGCCALTDTLRLTRHTAAHGCRRVLMLPPFYYKNPTDEGLFESYARVIEGVADPGLRVYLYHFPQLSGVPVTRGLLERLLARYPETVAGVKDSSGEWRNTAALLEHFPGLAVLPGSEAALLDALAAGAAGCITATANVNAAAIRATWEAWRGGDERAARAAQEGITAVRRIIEQHPLVAAHKHILSRFHGDPRWLALRPPLVALDEAAARRLDGELDALGFRLPAPEP